MRRAHSEMFPERASRRWRTRSIRATSGRSGLSQFEKVARPVFGLARKTEFVHGNLAPFGAEAFARAGIAHEQLRGLEKLFGIAWRHQQSVDIVPRYIRDAAYVEGDDWQPARGGFEHHL